MTKKAFVAGLAPDPTVGVYSASPNWWDRGLAAPYTRTPLGRWSLRPQFSAILASKCRSHLQILAIRIWQNPLKPTAKSTLSAEGPTSWDSTQLFYGQHRCCLMTLSFCSAYCNIQRDINHLLYTVHKSLPLHITCMRHNRASAGNS